MQSHLKSPQTGILSAQRQHTGHRKSLYSVRDLQHIAVRRHLYSMKSIIDTIGKLLSIGLVACLITACYYDVEEELYPDTGCDSEDISYSEDVLPLLQTHCLVCHSQMANFGNINLEGYDQVLVHVGTGGLLGSIRGDDGWSVMPQGRPRMLDCNIEKIASWIEDGAPNN